MTLRDGIPVEVTQLNVTFQCYWALLLSIDELRAYLFP